ncbi:MAG: DUF262 domain-containing protein [Bacilli bacterium]|nr:DUF262 domain-containing protein [Bacilli bacterium]MDD4795395.1 DUF262 domain-containing protein [Bacilli bacterium]
MAYQKKTILKTVEDIISGNMYLPAIQRKFVWNEEQITKLMDSILLGYPIGTFLYWKSSGKNINDKGYSLYEFIKDYHEKENYINKHAPKNLSLDKIIYTVLDGQQRLTSLYISLQGSIAKKIPRAWINNPNSYPKKELYFNLLSKKNDEDDKLTYEFKFLNEKQLKKDENVMWYKVSNILKYKDFSEVMVKEMIPNNWQQNENIINNISKLHSALVTDEVINYFEVETDTMNEILDIFVRINSGGTALTKIDLLFSTVVSHWEKARDEVDDLLKEINSIGNKFNFNNDYIMRYCLYILDFPISLKVESFVRSNVIKIKEEWEKIKDSIKTTVSYLNEFGFNSENIVSYLAVAPIIYYIYKGGTITEDNKNEMKKFFIVAQLKQIFGAASNAALEKTRQVLRVSKDEINNDYILKNKNEFKLSQFYNTSYVGNKDLQFTDDDIETLFDYTKGSYTFMILTLLYPNLKYDQKVFHQDHMHPFSKFNEEEFNKYNIDKETQSDWLIKRNQLPNLQLLEGRDNESKNADYLVNWLKVPSNKTHALPLLPFDTSYDLNNFDEFYTKRKKIMKKKLEQILISDK